MGFTYEIKLGKGGTKLDEKGKLWRKIHIRKKLRMKGNKRRDKEVCRHRMEKKKGFVVWLVMGCENWRKEKGRGSKEG